jgi:ubiquinone biosynthesis protein
MEVASDDIPIIGVMDFGMVGHISNTERMDIVQGVYLVTRGKARNLVDHLIRTGAVSPQIDAVALERRIDQMIEQYRGLSLQDIQVMRAVDELRTIAFQYRITLPPDLWLCLKTLSMMDGLARQLYPDFALFEEFSSPMRKIWIESRLPWNWGKDLGEEIASLVYSLRDFPGVVERLVRGLQRGDLPVTLKMGATRETMDRLDRVASRFSLSILAAAFILGLALLFPVAKSNTIANILAILGFAASLLLGVWIVISIIRTGK